MSLFFCSLASGSSGNCHLVGSERTKILVDAGVSGKYAQASLDYIGVDPHKLSGILLTHEHTDHILGLGVLMRKFNLPLYVTALTYEAIKDKIGKINTDNVHILENPDHFEVGDLEIKSVSIQHDAVDPRCYVLNYQKSSIGIATDLGKVTDQVLTAFQDCNLLMLESNHDEEMVKSGSYPYYLKRRILGDYGHLSNHSAGELATELITHGKVKNIILGHLSKENNFPELAYETVYQLLMKKGIQDGVDVQLDLTYRQKIGQFYKIKT